MSKLQPIRGTKDLINDSATVHNYIINIAKSYASRYMYKELSTPIFENTSVFYHTLGESSDIVTKETYTFNDRDGTSITLRPEFTAAVVRAFISNGMIQDIPLKLFSHGPVFRHERPQHCRLRQFHQLNFEFLGVQSPAADAEVIAMSYHILHSLGISSSIKLEINTIGDKKSRELHRAVLIKYLERYKEDLSHDSKRRLCQNLLRILDSKDPGDKKIIADAPKTLDYLTPSAREHYEKVLLYLESLGISYTYNPKLVRGLDYYTHTVFEFTTNQLGSQSTVIAGGRYDGLILNMGGPEISAVGFAAGIERIAALYLQHFAAPVQPKSFYIVPIGSHNVEQHAMKLAYILREKGLNIQLDYDISLKKRMQRASRYNAVATIIFGDNELVNSIYKVKNMSTGCEAQVPISNIEQYLMSIIQEL